MQPNRPKQHRPQHILILGVEVIPHLPIPIQHPTPININILTPQLEKGGSVLVHLLETVALPVVRGVGELDVPLDDYIHVLQECHVQWFSDDIGAADGEDDAAAVVAGVQGGEDVG